MLSIRVSQTGPPDVLQPERTSDPKPTAGQAVVQVEAAGVNFIEVYQRKGWYPKPLPFTPGTEGAGTVVSVGSGVTTVRPGDRVASVNLGGSYAELAVAAVDRLVTIPDAVSTRDAAALMLQGMTAHYLATSTYPLAKGQSCLIHAAAGGVGLLLCQIAKRRGARVFGTASTEEKAARAREAGADHVILYTREDVATEVRRRTEGRGVHVVYDSVGQATYEGSLDSLAPLGMLVLFGQASGPVPPLDAQVLNQKGSLFLTRPTLAHYVATREALTARAEDLFAWVRAGWLRLRIDAAFPLADAAEAHRALESRKTMGKLLLVP